MDHYVDQLHNHVHKQHVHVDQYDYLNVDQYVDDHFNHDLNVDYHQHLNVDYDVDQLDYDLGLTS